MKFTTIGPTNFIILSDEELNRLKQGDAFKVSGHNDTPYLIFVCNNRKQIKIVSKDKQYKDRVILPILTTQLPSLEDYNAISYGNISIINNAFFERLTKNSNVKEISSTISNTIH